MACGGDSNPSLHGSQLFELFILFLSSFLVLIVIGMLTYPRYLSTAPAFHPPVQCLHLNVSDLTCPKFNSSTSTENLALPSTKTPKAVILDSSSLPPTPSTRIPRITESYPPSLFLSPLLPPHSTPPAAHSWATVVF